MPLIVDTWNVLLATDGTPDAAAWLDIRGLVDLISRSRFRAETARLVCDGAPTAASASIPAGRRGIEILYSGAGREADALIEDLIDRDSAPGRLTVVSSDRRIRRAARRRRCRSLTSAAFLHTILGDAARPRQPHQSPLTTLIPLSDPEIDHWLARFELDDDLLALPAAPDPPAAAPASAGSRSASAPAPRSEAPSSPPAPPPPPDPLLLEALRAWPGLRLEDLDMSRWLERGR